MALLQSEGERVVASASSASTRDVGVPFIVGVVVLRFDLCWVGYFDGLSTVLWSLSYPPAVCSSRFMDCINQIQIQSYTQSLSAQLRPFPTLRCTVQFRAAQL